MKLLTELLLLTLLGLCWQEEPPEHDEPEDQILVIVPLSFN